MKILMYKWKVYNQSDVAEAFEYFATAVENFLSYLQQLLTMVDSRNECSIALAKTALSAVFSLAKSSGMIIVAVVAEIIFPSKER